ncbi:MAG: four helix bundle suffix domain-containing protein [Fimbriimonadales bacterium]
MPEGEHLLPPHGSYRSLKAFQNTVIIHDATVAFCRRFFKKSDRTVDQMVQAARSGKQNIAEGSSMSGTSKASELKLIGVARASLEELLNDYEDFLRQRDFLLWPKGHLKTEFIRRLAYRENKSYETYRAYVEEKSPETAANTMICVIRQTCFLLDRLKNQFGQALLEEGGINERIYRERKKKRGY